MTRTVPATDFDDAAWNGLVQAMGGWFYHTSYWRRLLCAAYAGMEDVSVAVLRGDTPVALLPLIRIRKFGFSKAFSMPFSMAGPIGESSAEIDRVLRDYLRGICDGFKCGCRTPLSMIDKSQIHEQRVAEVDVGRSEEDLRTSLAKSLIRDIKSKQAEVEMRPAQGAEDLRSIQRIYRERMKLLNSPGTYNDALLAGILELPEHHRKVTIARIKEGPDVGFNIMLYSGDLSFYFANATLNTHPQHCISTKLMWDDLKWASAHGVRIHYLGGGLSGTQDDSLYRFKARWGRSTLEYAYHLNLGPKGQLIEWIQRASGNRLIGLGLRAIGVR